MVTLLDLWKTYIAENRRLLHNTSREGALLIAFIAGAAMPLEAYKKALETAATTGDKTAMNDILPSLFGGWYGETLAVNDVIGKPQQKLQQQQHMVVPKPKGDN